ncbi:type IA DNA topoisomerase [Moraxella sp. ZJ142]|uniref:type IA DNA topoisomerase n=1 Tax=Moraxella marmotae TaxID=3344520 RepID=UPI0035D43EC2
MSKTLVIVESSKKAKTIGNILGDDYKVISCGGHIRNMTKKNLGFNKDTLQIEYEKSASNQEWVNKVKNVINKGTFGHVILAADPDREGEAIAQSLKEELGLTDANSNRATFHEITETAIKNAIQNGADGKIDTHLVNAQEARRILDRYVGWECTDAVSSRTGRKMPVGRVQSQAVLFVVEREREIVNFTAQPYFNVKAISKDGITGETPWFATLDLKASELGVEVAHRTGTKLIWTDENAVKALKTLVESNGLMFQQREQKEAHSSPRPPFITSTLQQAAMRKLKLSGKKIDEIAQSLYQDGYITYPRTDNANISDEKFEMIKAYCLKESWPVSPTKRSYSNKKNAQEAHEAILPTFLDHEPPLEGDHKALYEMIKSRAIVSQLIDKQFIKDTATFHVQDDTGKTFVFKAVANKVTDPGFSGYFDSTADESIDDDDDKELESTPIPEFSTGQTVKVESCEIESKETTPPPRYTQASLNKKLDDTGIGRPSTYSTVYEKIKEHGYITEEKDRKIAPTPNANLLVENTEKTYSIMQHDFTSKMEKELDQIACNEISKEDVLRPFFAEVDKNNNNLKSMPPLEGVYKCQKQDCDGTLIRYQYKDKKGKAKEYLRCQACQEAYAITEKGPYSFTMALAPFLNEDGTPKHPCPNCGSAMWKRNKKDDPNSYFWACSNSNKPKERCEKLADDNNGVPDFSEKTEKWWRDYYFDKFVKAGNKAKVCPICNEHSLYLVEPKNGDKFWKCKNCCARYYLPKDDSEPNFEYWGETYKNILKDDKQTPKYACPDCGGALRVLNANKDESEWKIHCSGIYPSEDKRCSFNADGYKKYTQFTAEQIREDTYGGI